MGRPVKEIDLDVYYDLASMGVTQKDMASELGVSIPTLEKRIADIQTKQGLLLKYRELQSLQLTELQARVLEAITPEKIESATLGELVNAFKILKDKELVVDGKPSEIHGLVGYLLHLEKEEIKIKNNIVEVANAKGLDIEDAEFVDNFQEDEELPKL
jgi:hypothetical protein